MLENGFRKCGLYPFDVNALDFSKIMRRIPDLPITLTDNSEPQKNTHETIGNNSLKVFENFLTPSHLEAFRLNKSPIWGGLKKDEGLFEIWYKLSHPILHCIPH